MKNITSIQNKHRWAQLVFLVLPTILVAGFLLWQANSFFSILNNQWVAQALYFGIGITVGSLLYSGRLRFITSFLLILAVFFISYRFIDNISVGEFDAFFISKSFLVFAILFSLGIFMGWGLQRYSYFSIIVSSFFFLLSIYLLSKTGEFTMKKIILVLVPIIFYCIYLIFTANELFRYKANRSFNWSKLMKRLVLFFLFLLISSAGVILILKNEIKDTLEQYGTAQANDDNSMLKKNKDGTVQNQEKMGMKNNNKRTNELVFCAYINNFFEGSDFPNPLYLTSYYFTKFDTLTETFERDPLMPFKDEFAPDPSAVPLFSKEKNKSVLDSANSNKMLQEVEIEVYKKRLAADAFVAPHTAYEVQPITVEKDFQDEYLHAYRAKSKVSKLNSAYFIYNTDDEMINAFQKQRFAELRKARNYKNTDKRFLDYYTFFPTSRKFSNFKTLADSLGNETEKTIDKVLAIRSYFKQKNPLGEGVYSYSDNPGIPGLPGASKLSTFMFETKKGWCTYYAGSSLLLLRAMKIPSRIAVGFLTVDRSDNNKGWYWYYQDQAHAWVQVYFPEYGWLDFDMTIGNEEAQQSPKPDGTPPMQPPKAVVVASGNLIDIDTALGLLQLQTNHFLYKEKEFKNVNEKLSLDISKSKIWFDSLQISASELKPNDYVTSVSYNQDYGSLPANSLETILNKLPKPLAIDEVYVKKKKQKVTEDEKSEEENMPSGLLFLLKILLLVLFVLLFILSLPYLILKGYALRFKRSSTNREKSYRLFRYTSFYLNQLGYEQKNKTLAEYAKNDIVPEFKNDYDRFAHLHQQIKFSSIEPSQDALRFLDTYYSTFTDNIRQKTTFKERLKKFINPRRAFMYFLSYANN